MKERNENDKPVCEKLVIYRGKGHLPGGAEELQPPDSTGAGDWDKVGGPVGAGGCGGFMLEEPELPCRGNNGGIRIYRAGFTPKSDPEDRWWIGRTKRN